MDSLSNNRRLRGCPGPQSAGATYIDKTFNETTQNDCLLKHSQGNIHNYIVKEVIGHGAYSIVRKATYKPENLKRAVKTYAKTVLLDPKKRECAISEVRVLRRISHPNIVSLCETIETSTELHLIFEYLTGPSLSRYLKSKNSQKLPESECKAIVRQILAALGYLHSKNILHRDLKLENILFTDKNTIKIIDLGFSTDSTEPCSIFCGTPNYMAPEILNRRDSTSRTDVWALGVILYHLLTGKPPFYSPNEQELFRKIKRGHFSQPTGVSKEARAVLTRTLETAPLKRPTVQHLLRCPWLCEDSFPRPDPIPFKSDSLDLNIISELVLST